MDGIEQYINIRKKLGISQRKLAEMADHNQADIARIESGRVKNPSIRTIEKFLDAMGYRFEAVPADKDISDKEGDT